MHYHKKRVRIIITFSGFIHKQEKPGQDDNKVTQ